MPVASYKNHNKLFSYVILFCLIVKVEYLCSFVIIFPNGAWFISHRLGALFKEEWATQGAY